MQSDYVSLKTFKQRFHVLSEIGRGGQAYVKEAVDLQNNQHVALKIYKKSKMTLTNLNQAHFENDITRTFDDPTILKNIGYFEDQEYICIIFELMHTNLRHLLSQENLREDILSEYNVCRMFAKMVRSIVVCHEANIIHRDVKLENFLVKNLPDEQELDIKLSDFGIACQYNKFDPPSAIKGSLTSVAPEVLTQDSYNFKVDCWSLGVILYELLTTVHPFYSKDSSKSMENIVSQDVDFDNEEIWQDVSQAAKDLVLQLLEKKAVMRLGVDQILSHPWFNIIKAPVNIKDKINEEL